MKVVENPFFSVIIPCYNSRKTIGRLLKSIVDQNMSNEIQVILADDHSTEPYDDVVKPFLDRLCIETITTDYNCCPGNTREKGVSIARGTWLVFADHDDIFLPNVFRGVKSALLKNKEEYIAYTNIYRARNTTGKFTRDLIQIPMTSFTGLLYGKFFNRENLWNKYDVHFKKDMFNHEDTYVCSIAKCILNHVQRYALYIDLYTYVWFNNSDSLTNTGGIKNFLEEHFHYYMEGTNGVYKEYLDKRFVSIEFALHQMIRTFLYEYFYMQLFMFTNPETYVKENVDNCRNELLLLKKTFGVKNTDIFWYCGKDNAKLFSEIQREAGYGYIPNYSLMEWMNLLDKDK